jgi:hypothetical protein
MTMSNRKSSIYTRVAVGYALALLSTTGVVYADNSPDPLFTSEDIIEVRLEAPFQTLMHDRSIDEEIPALFQYINSDGKTIEFDAGLRVRGNFRRREDICDFTPLRLNFKKSQTKGTLFDHQDKLKLVTHCKSSSPRYKQYVLSEYLVYKIFNLMTDVSFRVRLLRVTYVDTAHNDREKVSLAFLIEHQDRLAKRIDTAVIETRSASFLDLDLDYTNLASVFHYFIGNTDFSPIATSLDKNCCHNHSLFGNEGEKIYSIPYDFDMAGFVNAPHARPNPRFKLRSVRDRRYRGRCFNNSRIPASVERFFVRQEEIYPLIDRQSLMTRGTRKAMLRFVDGFFKSLNSPEKIAKELNKNCV